MSPTEIRTVLAQVLEDTTDVTAAEVTDDSSLADDLDIDSLSMVEVVVAIEDRFGVSLSEEALAELPTVGDLVAHLAQVLAPSAAVRQESGSSV